MKQRLCQKYEAYVVTEYRDGAVFKTQKCAEFYVPLGTEFPSHIGDLIITPTSDPLRKLERP